MSVHSKNIAMEKTGGPQPRFGGARVLWPRLIELWISAVLATFFLIRVIGSHTGQRLLDRLRHTHLL
jgi:hypothetical protein